MLLKIENLNIFIKERIILEDINISIKENEIVSILGNSGVGKTMLAHAILGLTPKDISIKGGIYFKDSLLDIKTKKCLRGSEISYIPQSISYLDPLVKVGVQACGKFGKSVYPKVKECFESLGLAKDVLNMYPHELSGGMARRVLISTALIANPSLIIADEATSSLDLDNSLKLLDIFNNLKKTQNTTIVLITHDISLATKISDRIIVLNDKKVVEDITKNHFFDISSLKNGYTKTLFSAATDADFINCKQLDINTKDNIVVRA